MRLRCSRGMGTQSGTIARALRRAGTMALIALIATTVAAFAQDAPPPGGGLLAVEGEADSDADFDSLVVRGAEIQSSGTGVQIHIEATGTGWFYSPFPLYILNAESRPWVMEVDAEPMAMPEDPGNQIELADVEVRDGAIPTEWASCDGTPRFSSPGGGAAHIALQFRVMVRAGHAPGHYVSPMTLEWFMPPHGDFGPASGQLQMELHVNVPQFFSVSTDVDSLRFLEESGSAEGWIYSETGQLQINSNQNFQISLSTGEKLTGPEDTQLPTAMMLSNTTPGAPEWASWGYLGGTEESLAETPWAGDPDPASPWPGQIGTVHEAFGQTTYDIDFGAWRSGLQDAHGEYSTTIVITVALD